MSKIDREYANLKRAQAKMKHFSGKTWCGCFTPSEILALINAGVSGRGGAKIIGTAEYLCLLASVKTGVCNPGWFYFEIHNMEMVEG